MVSRSTVEPRLSASLSARKRSSISVTRIAVASGNRIGRMTRWSRTVLMPSIPAIDVIRAGEASGGQQHDQKQRGHGKADDDGGEYQRLGHRVGIGGWIGIGVI